MPAAKESKAAAPAANPDVFGKCEANLARASEHTHQITTDLQLILEQDGCANILRDAGGSPAQAPFTQEEYANAMANVGIYRCGGNALWAGLQSGPVAVNKSKLETIIKTQFETPKSVFPETVIIAVTSTGPKPTNEKARGTLVRISPEEPLHAWVVATARSIRAGEGPEVLAQWVNMIQSASLEFRKIDDAKRLFWEQVAERESVGRRFATLFRTASGRVLEIVAFAEMESKRAKKELSRPEIAKAWEMNFKASAMSDPVNFTMVDAAMKVYNGIFRHKEAADLVLETENMDTYPGGSHWTVYKLVEVVRKARSSNAVNPERVVEIIAGAPSTFRHSLPAHIIILCVFLS